MQARPDTWRRALTKSQKVNKEANMATVTKEERDKLYNEYKFSFGSDGYINKYIGYLHTFWPERVYDLGRLRL